MTTPGTTTPTTKKVSQEPTVPKIVIPAKAGIQCI